MQTFRKAERLKSKKLISELFQVGRSFNVYPLRVVWHAGNEELTSPASVLITVQKKKIKKVYQRNLLKRRIREAYRKNKKAFYEFLSEQETTCVLAIIYTSGEITSYDDIEKKIIYIFQRLQQEYENSNG